jgi:DNA-binding response OmpR family regulator
MSLPIAPYRLLVVDDDRTILTLFSTALQRAGHEVSTAACGQEALRKVMEQPVDVMLLDINLPDMSGIEVMRQIVKTTSTIVIVMTGGDASYSRQAAIREGAVDFFVKPVRLPDLLARISQAMDMRRMTEAKERAAGDFDRLATRDGI